MRLSRSMESTARYGAWWNFFLGLSTCPIGRVHRPKRTQQRQRGSQCSAIPCVWHCCLTIFSTLYKSTRRTNAVCGTWDGRLLTSCRRPAQPHMRSLGPASCAALGEGFWELRERVAWQIALHGPHTKPTLRVRRLASVAPPPLPSCRKENAGRRSRSRCLCVAKGWEPSERAKAAIASAGEVRSHASAAVGASGKSTS